MGDLDMQDMLIDILISSIEGLDHNNKSRSFVFVFFHIDHPNPKHTHERGSLYYYPLSIASRP